MMLFNVYCVALALVAIGIFGFFKWSFNYWRRKGVYALPPSIPFGNAKNLITQKWCMGEELCNVYNRFKKKSLPFGGYYFMTKPIFVPVDLDLIKKILITDFEHFTNHTLFTQDYDPLSRHLYALKGSEWKMMRTKLSPAFTSAKVKMYFNSVLNCIHELTEILDDAALANQTVDAKDLISRLSIDVIASCAFGFESNSLKNPNSNIKKIVTKFFHCSVRNSVIFLFALFAPQILCAFKIKFTQNEITDFFMNLIRETVRHRETNKVVRSDFVHLLLQVRNNIKISDEGNGGFEQLDEQAQLTIEEMAAQCMVFFVGGFETSCSTITYCLYELCKNGNVQDKARKEVRNCVFEGNLTYEVLHELSYLEQVIYETMRMYPPTPIHARECTNDYTIPNTNVNIQKGCFVYVPVWAIQMDPEIYPDPYKFDPERFSSKNMQRRHPCAWSPFGVGPRACIAYQFGLMETKLVLASLLNTYRFTLSAQTKVPLRVDPKAMILMPSDEVWLNFERL